MFSVFVAMTSDARTIFDFSFRNSSDDFKGLKIIANEASELRRESGEAAAS